MKNWLTAQWNRLIIRFSTPRTLLVADQALVLSSRTLAPEIVVGRDLCHYTVLDLQHVPQRQRQQALQHHVEAHSPWPQPDYFCAWRAGRAQVWLWDAAQVEKQLASREQLSTLAMLRARTALRLPESIFYNRPDTDGVFLQTCHRGFELQAWRNGILSSSRWYPNKPDDAATQWFSRAQGLEFGQSVQASPDTHLQPTPWTGSRPPIWQWFQLRQRNLAAAILLISISVASLQVSATLHWMSLENDYRQQAAALQTSAGNLLQAKGQAKRALIRHDRLHSLFDHPAPLAAQWRVASRMPDNLDYEVVIWERTDKRVEMVIKAELSDTLSIVQALNGKGLADVTVDPWRQPGHHSIRLQLTDIAQQESPKRTADATRDQ